jgi:hypothetical protein
MEEFRQATQNDKEIAYEMLQADVSIKKCAISYLEIALRESKLYRTGKIKSWREDPEIKRRWDLAKYGSERWMAKNIFDWSKASIICNAPRNKNESKDEPKWKIEITDQDRKITCNEWFDQFPMYFAPVTRFEISYILNEIASCAFEKPIETCADEYYQKRTIALHAMATMIGKGHQADRSLSKKALR